MTAGRLCVIGDPVGHSLSPLLHRAMIAQTGVPYTYELHPMSAAALPEFVAAAKDGAWAGCNVTMPHKQTILPLLDEVDGFAADCGAVNTVCFRDGRAVGYNTDGVGLVDSLRCRGFDPAGRTVLLLGAGGAASAVCCALARAGASHIFVAARRPEAARTLSALCPGRVEAVPFDGATLRRALAESTLLINATPLGMDGKPPFPELSFLRAAPREAVVYDLVYQPRRTALLASASACDLATVPGTSLLLHQAVRAFTLFTGAPVNVPALSRAVERQLG